MSSHNYTIDYADAVKWMNTNFPNCKKLDVNWTMERYDFPEFVRNWIKETWFKESDECGGTYVKNMHIDGIVFT